MSNCQHELQEREDACADGYCPICMAIDLRNARAALSQQQAEPDLQAELEDQTKWAGHYARRASDLFDVLLALEQAYSNPHSPQHRAACLAEAKTVLASLDARPSAALSQKAEPDLRLNKDGVPEWLPPKWGGSRLPDTLYYAAPPADDAFRSNAVAEIASLIRQRDEAVRLLERSKNILEKAAIAKLSDGTYFDKDCACTILITLIDAYLARVK